MKSNTIGVLALIGVTAVLSAGCAAHAQASGMAEAEAPVVFVGTPTLVVTDSNLWVVRDADRATYYVDEYYWVNRDGTWYRSRSYDGGWVVIEASAVPAAIATRNHDTDAHYHGDATAQTRPAPRGDAVASTETTSSPPAVGNPHGAPPGHDEVPGVGNQRKAEGEQPGNAHAMPPAKTDGAQPSSDPPPAAKPHNGEGHGPAAKKDDKKKK